MLGRNKDPYPRCDGSEDDAKCIATEDTCICGLGGLGCSEYGPPWAPGRCPEGDFYALCSSAEDAYVCIISCTEDSDCPDPDMVCRPCPGAFAEHCLSLGELGAEVGLNAGTSMCTWPLH